MDINNVVMENKAGVPVVPASVGQGVVHAELVKPVSSVDYSANGSMDEQSLESRQQGRGIVSREEAAKYAEEIQGRLDKMGSNLLFSVDEETESIVYQFTSKENGEVLRQFPSDEILELRRKLDDLLGIIFDKLV